LLAGYADAGLLKGERAVHSVDGPAQATKEKASMAETQAMGFCLKAAKAAFSDTLQALKKHYRKNLKTTEHVVVVWNPYSDSEPMCVTPLQMGCPPSPLLLTFTFCVCFCVSVRHFPQAILKQQQRRARRKPASPEVREDADSAKGRK
jgi:hypothetical protein